MDTAVIGKLFNQLSVKDNVNQNGIGFGLTISKLIVEKLGGKMIFRNHTNFDKVKARVAPRKRKSCNASVYSEEQKKFADFKQVIFD